MVIVRLLKVPIVPRYWLRLTGILKNGRIPKNQSDVVVELLERY